MFPAVRANAQASPESSARECITDTQELGDTNRGLSLLLPQVPPASQDYIANNHSHFTWLWIHRFLRQTQTTKQAAEPNDNNRTSV